MDPSVLLAAAIASIVLFIVISAVTLVSSTRQSVPNYPLWPPTYNFPDRARVGGFEDDEEEGPPTGSFRIPTAPTGIAVGDSTNPTRHAPEADPNATQAFMAAYSAPEKPSSPGKPIPPHTGVKVTDETNKIRLSDLDMTDWLDAETNKFASPPHGVSINPPKDGRADKAADSDADKTAQIDVKKLAANDDRPERDKRDTNPKKPKGLG